MIFDPDEPSFMNTLSFLFFLLLWSGNAFSQNKNLKLSTNVGRKGGIVTKHKLPVRMPRQEHSWEGLLYYHQDGKWIMYKGNAHSLGEFWKDIGVYGRTYVTTPACNSGKKGNDCSLMIGYKFFTNQPQWAVTKDTTKIRKYTDDFNVDELMASLIFEFKLGLEIKKHAINDTFLLETLGLPDRKREDLLEAESEAEIWDYDRYKLAITLKKGVAVSCSKVD